LNVGGEAPILIGGREGEIFGLAIQVGVPHHTEVDTVTIYLGKSKQADYIDYIIDVLKPRRIIFNPGAENPILAQKAKAANIMVSHACTLVLFATDQY